jgi:protease IV
MNAAATPPPDPIRAELAAAQARGPIRVILEQPRSSWIARGLKWAITLIILLVIISASIDKSRYGESELQEKWHSLSKTAADKVAIIAVEGTIMGDESFVKKQIDHVADDDHVKAVVLRIDSPGGTVTGSDYIYHHVKLLAEKRHIPLVVSMGSVAASGGYYVAMAAGATENTIYAEPTTWTGSIGVIIPHYDISGLLEKLNVQDDSIASNPLKMMGSPTRKFPEAIRAEEQAILKGLVESSFDGFKEIVLAGRPALRDNKDVQAVVFTGRIFTAKQAQENLLVDRLGFIEDAIDRAIELANLDKDDVQVVKFRKPIGLMEQLLFGGQQNRRPSFDLGAVLELASPKAYYLCTFLPGLSSSAAE